MKAGLLAVAAFTAVAVAQPHRKHMDLHAREAAVETAWYTEVDVVTATAPAAYVYVDQNGNPVSEAQATPAPVAQHGNWDGGDHGHHSHSQGESAAISTSIAAVVAPAPVPTTTSVVAPVVPVVSIPAVSTPAVSIPPVVVTVASSHSAPVASSTPVSSSGSGLGISYSPYTVPGGPCRSADQVATEIKALSGYSSIRLYGTDCDQISNVMAAISPQQKVFLGIFFITADKLDGEISTLKSQVNGRWNLVEAIAVGNELIENNSTPDDIFSAVGKVRSALSDYSGVVTTVETVGAYLNNPNLCAAGDRGDTKAPVYANCHPFFDPHTTAAGAGPFVLGQIAQIKSKCPNRDVIIAESGWPTASAMGMTNGDAIPGISQQADAIKSLRQNFSSGLYLFSAHNELWKPIDAKTFGVEQSWGLQSL